MAEFFGVEDEAKRIMALPPSRRPAAVGEALSRTVAAAGDDAGLRLALDYNANLCTALREIATAMDTPSPWG